MKIPLNKKYELEALLNNCVDDDEAILLERELGDNEIIDFNRKGNVIRFYLGKNGKQWGDDWNDIPYEHNAGRASDEFIKGYCDIAIDFDYEVEEICDNTDNSEYSKLDMVKRIVFALVIIKDKEYIFERKRIYFGDKIEDILKLNYVKLLERGDYTNG
uniref:Uncharacterized protein n=1 Tax=viral metagenome TaxID=1070528 RepID=A0A6H1ZLQ4_9ZZZZ